MSNTPSSMTLVDTFPTQHAIDIDPGWPERGEEVIAFQAYDQLKMHTGEFQDLRFYIDEGGSWIGRFERGQRQGTFANSVATTPSPNHACVISSGAGYWVNIKQKRVTPIECLPITQVEVSKKRNLIILATWRDLYAYTPNETAWISRDLAMDDLKIISIDEDTILVSGLVMGCTEQFRVDLATGQRL